MTMRKYMIASLCALFIFLMAACGGGAEEVANSGGAAPAQDVSGDIIGQMNGDIDGEAFTVYFLKRDFGDGVIQSTAQFDDWRHLFGEIKVSASAHQTSMLGWTGTMSFGFSLDDDLKIVSPSGAPEMTYFESLTKGFNMSEGTLELTEIDWVNDDIITVKGSFGGTFTNPINQDKKEINGTFVIDEVRRIEEL